MTKLPIAHSYRQADDWTGAYDQVVLRHDQRQLHRARLETAHEENFVVDLPHSVALQPGDALQFDDGRLIEVIAAEEEVLVVTGDLARLAWHIGSRQVACQIEAARLLIRVEGSDSDLIAALRELGAKVVPGHEPFIPEVAVPPAALARPPEHLQVRLHVAHFHGEDDEAEAASE
ncbi:MAG: urease accessory protein UreE [Pseudorhodobacter sp.]|nr:urease accessory protein UreE [Pseudorhodobacter sp.]